MSRPPGASPGRASLPPKGPSMPPTEATPETTNSAPPHVVVAVGRASVPPPPAFQADCADRAEQAASEAAPATEPVAALAKTSGERPEPTPEATPEAQATAEEEDEVSIPPVVEPVAEEFFSQGDLAIHLAPEDDELQIDERVRRSLAPEAVARRARYARMVRLAVVGGLVVCVAALARTLVAPRAVGPSSTTSFAAPPPPAVAEATPEAPAAAPAPPAPAAASAEPAASPEPAASAAAAADAANPAAALAAKNRARAALEANKLVDAIAAGEASVALDPTDGEAWLLLGAAYQEKGNAVEARRCYVSCSKLGKRGPVGECQAMLR